VSSGPALIGGGSLSGRGSDALRKSWPGAGRLRLRHDFRAVHRFLRILSTMLITAGLVVLADVGLTLAWKEPLSTIYGSIQQGKAEDQLDELTDRFPGADDLRAAAGAGSIAERVEILADRFEDEVEVGKAIGRIRIEAIELDVVVIEGTDTSSLQKGPGHYTPSPNPDTRAAGDGSAFPGQGRTIGIAGHRTTYLAPFRRLDELEEGDELILEMPYATFTYEVEKTDIVDPSEFEVVRDVDYERLVLTACHPLYSAAQRIVAFGRLTDISLFGSGERLWQDP
jgi:sortase A